MSKVKYKFHPGIPPREDVYKTIRGSAKCVIMRYWDGKKWWRLDMDSDRNRPEFVWPKNSITPKPKLKDWQIARGYHFYLGNINDRQDKIQWGEPYTEYTDREITSFMVDQGVLPPDWREKYQEQMRNQKERK